DARIVVVGYGSLLAAMSGHNVRGTGRRAARRDKTDIVLSYIDSCVSGQNVQSAGDVRTVGIGVCHPAHWSSLTGTLSSTRRLLVLFVPPDPSENSGLSNRLTVTSCLSAVK